MGATVAAGGCLRGREAEDLLFWVWNGSDQVNPQILQCSMTTSANARSHASELPSDPAAREALSWTQSARFLTTASLLTQLPPPDLPEVAFVGRSNAGKSTAINTLAQHRRLAFASKTPGRTQHINLFEVGPIGAPDALWADLPGYGYAAVARGAKLRWQQVMADYLANRHALSGIVMMVDSRHGFTPLDKQLLDFVSQRVGTGEVKLLVLLTKADKLSRNEASRALAQAQKVLGELATDSTDISVALFSALSRQGIGDAALTLRQWITARPAAGADPQAVADAPVDAPAGAGADTPPGADAAPLSPA